MAHRIRTLLFLLTFSMLCTGVSAATLTLTVTSDSLRYTIPTNFIGLSYGPDALGDTTQLKPTDNAMLTLLRQIGPGVLRFGGNSMDNKGIIPFDSTKYKRALDFVNTIGWKIMIGMPLGTFDTTGAKSIVKFTSGYSKNSILSYEVGNEPDLYTSNGLRPSTYAVTNYETEFNTYYTAIRRVVPDAPFSGPTTAKQDWVAAFAAAEASRIMLLTQHHYVEAPGGTLSAEISTLLSPSSKQSIVSKMNSMQTAANAARVPARLSECNSVWSGGQTGVCDVFAATLWTTDFMFAIANAGNVGVNFHGGGTGPYTPIADSNGIIKARPEYYGIMMFKYASGGRIVKSKLSDTTVNVGAYVVKSSGDSIKIAFINKDSVNAYTINVQGIVSASSATVIRLQAASIHSATGITFGGDSITTAKPWAPLASETIVPVSSAYAVSLPKASAAVVTIPLASTGCTAGRAGVRTSQARNLRMIMSASATASRFLPQSDETYYSIRGERLHYGPTAWPAGQPIIVERKSADR